MTLAMALFALAVVLLATAWWLHFSQPPRPLLLDDIEQAPAVTRDSWYRIPGAYPRIMREELPTIEWHPGLTVPTEPAPTSE